MGFGLRYLQASAAESAKVGAAEVSKLEEAAGVDDAAPSPVAPQATQTTSAQAPVSSPAAPSAAPSRPNAFSARPGFGAPSSATSPSTRPSFTPARAAEPAAPAAPVRPSFGSGAASPPVPKEQPSRPSFGGSAAGSAPPAAGMPNARAVFVKTQAKFCGLQGAGSSSAASDADALSPQALFEIVCTHRNMSRSAIEAAKAQAQDRPEAVLAQMRRIYDQEIAPSRVKHASDLPKAKEENPDKIVFLLRKDDKERLRIMSHEDAEQSGEVVLHGTTVENIHAASSPFLAPSELFAAVEPEVAPAPVAPAEPSPRSPKP